MPIVIQPATSSPLSQGDILEKVPFAMFKADEPDERAVVRNGTPYVLVVSRPCKAIRSPAITVAPITKWPIKLTELDNGQDLTKLLDNTRRLLMRGRDGIRGGDHSELFYLGPLKSGATARYCADLSTLSTVLIPEKEPERTEWVTKRRVGRLATDFLRDLHLRLFFTYARLGFDDLAWLPDADLDLLIKNGEREIRYHRSQAERFKDANESLELWGQQGSRAELKKHEELAQSVESALKPYLEERERRRQTT